MHKSSRLPHHALTPSGGMIRRLVGPLCFVSSIACGAKHTPATGTQDAGAHSTVAPTTNQSGVTSRTSTVAPTDAGDPIVVADAAISSSSPTSNDAVSPIAPSDTFLCGGAPCACSDGIDNDGDGLTDGMDQECTGPLDNEEATFATGIPGDNRDPKWQDCFFDGNSGAGDDGCRYHTDCLTGDADESEARCGIAQACIDFCRPLTPPGCDCFGCCEVPFEGASIGIQLSPTCSLANINDEQACPRCRPSPTCSNECGECELCVGKTLADLPASCGTQTPPSKEDAGTPTGDAGTEHPTSPGEPDVPANSCDHGAACESNADCAAGDYCRLGCCIDYTPQVF